MPIDFVMEIQTTLQSILDDPSVALNTKTNAADVIGWDSMTHMMLIAKLEKKFHLKFQLAEIQELSSVGDIVSLLEKRFGPPP